MTLIELLAENYRQHKKIHVKFEGNTIGLIGENGTGKSNCLRALNYAFSGSLSGETRDSDTKQLPIVKWGAKSGFVKVVFEHLGKRGEVLREFSHSKVDAHFNYDGMKCSGTTQVNTVVSEMLGLDKDVCRQAVFVEQDELDSILFTDPRNRKLAWQKLCGIGQVGDVHKKVGKFIAELPPIHDYSESIRDAEHQLAELEGQETIKGSTLVALKAALPAVDSSSLEATVSTLRRLQAIQTEAMSLQRDINYITDKNNTAIAALTVLRSTSGGNLATQTALVDQLAEAKATMDKNKVVVDQINDITTIINATDIKLAAAKAAIAALPTEEVLVASLKDVERLSSEIAGLDSALGMYTTLQAAAANNTVEPGSCNLCGQGLSSPEDVHIHVSTKVSELRNLRESKNLELVRLNYQQLQNCSNQRIKCCSEITGYSSTLTDYHTKLEGLRKSNAVFDAQEYANVITELNTAKNTLTSWQATASTAASHEATVRHCAANSTEFKGRLDKLLEEARGLIASSKVPPDDFSGQLAVIANKQREVQEHRVQVASLEGELTQLTKSITTLKGTIAKLRKSQSDQESAVKKLDVLKEVRDWFHYDNGPSIIINNLLDEITVATNDFLEKFDSSFAVIPNYQSMSFNYYYHNPEIPISDPYPHCSEMSGGEKVVLAVAFRLATYAMFAQRVGLLVLDEPSVYLDSKNVVKLGSLLYNIKTLAKNLGLQVLISTHEKSLMNHFDSIIDFGTKDNPSFG